MPGLNPFFFRASAEHPNLEGKFATRRASQSLFLQGQC